jgi:hypothetical protein
LTVSSNDDRNVLSLETQNTNNNYYENAFFGLSIEKPDGWYAMSSQELLSLVSNTVIPIVSNGNSSVEQFLKISTQHLIPLLGFMEYPFGAQNGKFNPNIVGWVTNMTGETNMGNDCDTFVHSKELLQGSEVTIISNTDCLEVGLNGKKFAMQELILNAYNLTIVKQTQYEKSTENGYSFSFTLSYLDEVDKNQLDHIMRTLKFWQ